MPGTLRRLWRDRLHAAAALVLVLAVVASSLLQTGVSTQLSQVLDQHWRGAYDLLVRPVPGDLDAASTGGFVEGNFVGLTGQGGISLSQLAKIRKVAGVDLAAPIGLVGQIGSTRQDPIVKIPDNPRKGVAVLPKDPTLYRLTFSVSLTDAFGARTVYSKQVNAVMRRQRSVDELPMVAAGGANGGGTPGLGMTFSVPGVPTFSSPVIAVDPVAEQELLGRTGSFLKPLVDVPAGPRTATQFAKSFGWWVDSLPERFSIPASMVESAPDEGHGTTPVIPLLINDTPPAKMTLTVTVQQSDKKIATMPKSSFDVDPLAKGATFTAVGSSSKDLSDVLVPFTPADLQLPWPGTKGFSNGDEFQIGTTVSLPKLVGRPAYRVTAGPAGADGTPSFRVQPQGVVAIDGTPFDPKSGVSGVQSYRSPVLPSDAVVALDPPLQLPIASFSLKDLDFGTTGVSYVPYGAYDPATTTLIADPAGQAEAPKTVVANPSGLDFISPVPGAITDLAGAQALRGDAPIDAVRVRVGGITAYTPAAQQKIIAVAKRIQAMGLAVTVVAGSSPQPVDVYVPQYRIDATGHPTGDLGWVRQDWTTLGATVTVRNALTALSITLLVLALAVAAILLLATAVAGRAARAEQVTVFTVLGWRRRRMLRWQLAPPLLLTVTVAAVAVAAVLVSGGRVVTMWPAAAAVTAALIGLLLIGASTVRSATTSRAARSARPRPGRSRGGPVGTPSRLAWRQTTTRPAGTLARVLAWSTIGAATAGVLAAVLQARTRTGGTRLAGLALDRTTVADLALAAVTVVAGAVMVLLARSIEQRHRTRQRDTLRLTGWTRRDTRRLALAHALIAAIPSVAVAAGLGAAIGTVVHAHPWWCIGIAAAVTALIATATAAADTLRAAR